MPDTPEADDAREHWAVVINLPLTAAQAHQVINAGRGGDADAITWR